ncbi:aminopeptidase [Clostridium oceanicum]|uniref:Aminopeptidase n=1 Tax=Clostridium oceanicum TaxID=1543 RepID=A0ABN1JLH5_9CLOT
MIDLKLLERLSNTDGISARENKVNEVLYDELKEYSDEISYDNLGSIIFKKKGECDKPKIMIAAHTDEVGFMVKNIDDLGFIHVIMIGRIRDKGFFLQEVRITTKEGDKVIGIINGEIDSNTNEPKDIYIDIGAKNREDVWNLGIRPGDMVTYTSEFKKYKLENIVAGKAFDDRLGCYILSEVMKKLKDLKHKNTVYGVGTACEEIGTRGGKTAAYKVNPDICFVIDVACARDQRIRNYSNNRQIGKGPMIISFDRTLTPRRKWTDIIIEKCNELKIDFQYDMFSRGGTDGGSVHLTNEGIPTVAICIPVRYGHCNYSILNVKDLENTINLLIEIIKDLDKENIKNLNK